MDSKKTKTTQTTISPVKHYRRLAIVLVGAVIGFAAIRSFAIPPTFGRDGHYRASAIDEIVGREPRYAGAHTCSECHAAAVEKARGGAHAQVPCETCHGPARGHLTLVKGRKKLIVDGKAKACLRCHQQMVGRPSKQPQINFTKHQQDNEFNDDVCTACHEAHEP